MELEECKKIRRFIYIGDEVRFLNSDKMYCYVHINSYQLIPLKYKITISLSNENKHRSGYIKFTREEFMDILTNKKYKLTKEEINPLADYKDSK